MKYLLLIFIAVSSLSAFAQKKGGKVKFVPPVVKDEPAEELEYGKDFVMIVTPPETKGTFVAEKKAATAGKFDRVAVTYHLYGADSTKDYLFLENELNIKLMPKQSMKLNVGMLDYNEKPLKEPIPFTISGNVWKFDISKVEMQRPFYLVVYDENTENASLKIMWEKEYGVSSSDYED